MAITSQFFIVRWVVWLLVTKAITMIHGFSFSHQYLALGRIDRSTRSTLLLLSATKKQLGQDEKKKSRVRFLNKLGFRRAFRDSRDWQSSSSSLPKDNDSLDDTTAPLAFDVEQEIKNEKKRSKSRKTVRYNVTTLEELDAYFRDEKRRFRVSDGPNDPIDYASLLTSLNVVGDTQIIGSPNHPNYTHPVVRLMHQRRQHQSSFIVNNTNFRTRRDGARIALSIEGGGMRGCVSAGMVCAIHYLNLTSTIDVVYGSSAGTIVGAYLITEQLPYFGPEVYYDALTTAGRGFIDTRRLLRALGFGLLDPRLLKDVLTRPSQGKPVLNLPFLLKKTIQHDKPIDWEKFRQKQTVQPLKVITSGCRSERAIIMDMENGSFETLPELANCMHASCLLPGIAGPLFNLDKRVVSGETTGKKMVLGNNLKGNQYEPLVDALLFEPIPYRSALQEGATHVLVLRSRPDGVDVTGKSSAFERLIFRRFFLRKNRLPRIYQRLQQQLHKKLYAQDIIRLNQEAHVVVPPPQQINNTRAREGPYLMALAVPPGSPEVTRLETRRAMIFDGLRRGFARAYDCLVDDPAERGRGSIVAKLVYPDEILNYDPLIMDPPTIMTSAYEAYLRQQGREVPRAPAQGMLAKTMKTQEDSSVAR